MKNKVVHKKLKTYSLYKNYKKNIILYGYITYVHVILDRRLVNLHYTSKSSFYMVFKHNFNTHTESRLGYSLESFITELTNNLQTIKLIY